MRDRSAVDRGAGHELPPERRLPRGVTVRQAHPPALPVIEHIGAEHLVVVEARGDLRGEPEAAALIAIAQVADEWLEGRVARREGAEERIDAPDERFAREGIAIVAPQPVP